MKVDIITPKAKMSLDMSAAAASRLLQVANELADGNGCATLAPAGNEVKMSGTPKIAEHGSRRARIFGDSFRRTEDSAEGKKPFRDDERWGGKGFIMNQCQNCGNVRTFHTKTTIKYANCACGTRTLLKGLKKASTYCEKCGRSVAYYTNLKNPTHVLKCLDCGADIRVRITPDGREYKTVFEPD